MPDCPYCGKRVNAFKNHVRLSSGGGHGASGQYPDDFDGGAEGGSGGDQTGVDAHEGQRSDEQVQSYSQTENVVQSGVTDGAVNSESDPGDVRDEGDTYEHNLEHGYEAGARDPHTDVGRNESELSCPNCGMRMSKPGAGVVFESARSKGLIFKKPVILRLEDEDLYCERCDLLINGGTGEVIPGSEFTPNP